MYATTPSLYVTWERCQGNIWCDLLRLNLQHPYLIGAEGVYIIWRADDCRTVRVGQGVIADRLAAHRRDPMILTHQAAGGLKVTWAHLTQPYRDGVEWYLAEMLQPLVGSAFPSASPISVNLPQ